MQTNDTTLLSQTLYEAALVPELWPAALGELAAFGNCQAALLFVEAGRALDIIASSPTATALAERYQSAGWPERNVQVKNARAKAQDRFIRDEEIFNRSELHELDYFRHFLRPAGLGEGCVTSFDLRGSPGIALSLHRRSCDGRLPEGDLNRLGSVRGDLGRALLLAMASEVASWAAQLEMLGHLGHAALLIDRTGRLLAMNPQFKQLEGAIWRDRSDKLELRQREVQISLSAFLERPRDGNEKGTSLVVPHQQTDQGWFIHLIPVTRRAQDRLLQGGYVVVASPIAMMQKTLDAPVLKQLFGLTQAEARVAHLIGGGLALPQIAEVLNVSTETVRSQAKAIFNKTGTCRQAELVMLLSNAAHAGHFHK